MTLPRPTKVRVLLSELNLEHLADEYEWAYRLPHTANTTGDYSRPSGLSDPTFNTAAAGMKLHVDLERFAECLHKAVAYKRGAESAMARAFAHLGRNEPRVTGDWAAPPDDDLNLGAQYAAKRRRQQRGEGWGAS